jgi:hypothetical protein
MLPYIYTNLYHFIEKVDRLGNVCVLAMAGQLPQALQNGERYVAAKEDAWIKKIVHMLPYVHAIMMIFLYMIL